MSEKTNKKQQEEILVLESDPASILLAIANDEYPENIQKIFLKTIAEKFPDFIKKSFNHGLSVFIDNSFSEKGFTREDLDDIVEDYYRQFVESFNQEDEEFENEDLENNFQELQELMKAAEKFSTSTNMKLEIVISSKHEEDSDENENKSQQGKIKFNF